MSPSPSDVSLVPETGRSTAEAARSFVDAAAASASSGREKIRAAIAASRDDERIDRALCAEFDASRTTDHSRSLIVLAILGERRTDASAECLRRVVWLPLPTKGTVVEGEIQERVSLETLQSKAAVGLAYRKSKRSDEEVLRIVGEHESPVVRGAALEAYLWNHEEELAAARERARMRVRESERSLTDADVTTSDLRPW